MDYAIFKTEEEKKAAVLALENLEQSDGWKTVLKALEINEDYFDSELHDSHFIDLRAVERLQDRINDLRKLKQLPRLLMEEARREDPAPPEDDSDPYKQ